MYNFQQSKSRLENSKLAGNIYQQENILVLQAPYQDDGSALNVFAQQELSSEQIGLQFGLQFFEDRIDYLIGVTLSNQDKSYEISAGNLRGDQKAFNLMYAFYNFPKKFFLVRIPFTACTSDLEKCLEQQLYNQTELNFINTAVKTNPHGEQYTWIKAFILQQALEMKVRIQIAVAN